MSEYQYYEFQAIDRPLNLDEMAALRKLSSRAEISPSRLTNTYHYGDFRGDPNTLMEKYFDAFLYIANWGTHRLMFRLPKPAIDVEAIEPYCIEEEGTSFRIVKDHVLLEFSSEQDGGGDWEEGEGQLAGLIALRSDLMNGDLRALYLGWLAVIQHWDADGGTQTDEEGAEPDDPDDGLEPPVPPGLKTLSGSLKALADFLRVDNDLLAVAAEASRGSAPAGPDRADLERWIAGLPATEKDDFLIRLAVESGPHPRAELLRRFREAAASQRPRGVESPDGKRRTVTQLLAARDARAADHRRLEAQREAEARARLAAAKTAERAKHLDALARRGDAPWAEVDALIATKRPKDYDRAVELLVDLRDLAIRAGHRDRADSRICELRALHSNKPSLLKRFDQAGLAS